MTAIALATCARWPELGESDRLYADALAARGAVVSVAPWNGPPEPFHTADAVILRSTWDYHEAPEAFAAWLDSLETRGRGVFNPPTLVRWNSDKRYLLDLAARGVRVPQTEVAPDDAAEIARVLNAHGWERAVVKPTVGASGVGVRLVRRGDLTGYAGSAAGESPVVVQEYMPELAAGGEMACVFFEGAYSHAFLRQPPAGEFRVNSQYGGTAHALALPEGVRAQAAGVLATLDAVPLYARVDGVLRGHAFVLMELELIEPGLGLHLAPGAADRFAEATLRRLRGAA